MAINPRDGNRGQTPLPPANPDADNGNNIGATLNHGMTDQTTVPGNDEADKGPQRGGTTVSQGQAGIAGSDS
jgi:hypothetical protein